MKKALVACILLSLMVFASCSKGKAGPEMKPQEQAVIVHFRYDAGNTLLLALLEAKLADVLKQESLGRYGGSVMDANGSGCSLYIFGPDARMAYAGIKDVLLTASFLHDAEVKLQFGPSTEGVREENLVLPE
jgi:hypothetical protein